MHPRQAVMHGLVSAAMQTGGLLKDLTVMVTVRHTASLFAQAKPAAEVMDRAGIAQIADRRVGKCSGGEQQRLRFAMALVSDPELLALSQAGRSCSPRITWRKRTPTPTGSSCCGTPFPARTAWRSAGCGATRAPSSSRSSSSSPSP
jgi:hypothetical protein